MPTRFIHRKSSLGPGDNQKPNANTIFLDSDTETVKVGSGASGTTENELNSLGQAQTITGVKTTAAAHVHTGAETHSGDETGIVIAKSVNFVEVGGKTALTATVPIPAGAFLLDIQFMLSVLAGGTSASLIIGDDEDPDGWLTATDLKATDLLVGEVFSILNSGTPAADSAAWVKATQGAYLTNAARKGSVVSGNAGVYYAAANNVIAVVTQGTPSTTGRYHMVVYYAIPTIIASVDT